MTNITGRCLCGAVGGVWFTTDAQAHNTPLPDGVPHFEGNG